MKEQRVIVLPGSDYESEMEKKINQYLTEGWQVVSVTAQHVATSDSQVKRGGYFVVLERSSIDKPVNLPNIDNTVTNRPSMIQTNL